MYPFLYRTPPGRLAVSPTHLFNAIFESNYCAEMTMLNVEHFADLGVGACPETPHSFDHGRVPKRPIGYGATTCILSDSEPIGTIGAFGAWANGLPHYNRNAMASVAGFSWLGTDFAAYKSLHFTRAVNQ